MSVMTCEIRAGNTKEKDGNKTYNSTCCKFLNSHVSHGFNKQSFQENYQ